MGIIRAALQTVTGAVKDQWTEVVEPEGMDDQTLLVQGTVKKSGGGRGSRDVISNGSVIHVYDNQFMILGGRRQGGGLHRGAGLLYGGQFLHALHV